MAACKAVLSRFDSGHHLLTNEYMSVAQLVECASDKREVAGSNPVGPISCFSGVMVAHDPSKVMIRVRLPTLAFCMGSFNEKNVSFVMSTFAFKSPAHTY